MIQKIIAKIQPPIVETDVVTGFPLREFRQTAAPLADGLLVSVNTGGKIVDANQPTSSKMPVAGMMTEGGLSGKLVTLIKSGLHSRTGWNFSGHIGRPVYAGSSGALAYAHQASGQIQQVGSVYNVNSIMVSISTMQSVK